MNKFILSFLLAAFTFISLSAQTFRGEDLFDDSYVHEIRCYFWEPNFHDTLLTWHNEVLDDDSSKRYLPVRIVIDGEEIDTVGVRYKGFFSFWGSFGEKKPIKIDFNEFTGGQKYDLLKKVNLSPSFNDPSLLKEKLCYDLMRDNGVKGPRAAHCNVYFNDQLWGLYTLIEQLDKTYLKSHYDNDEGNIYKCADGHDLSWFGASYTNYPEFQKKTNEDENDWSDFEEFVDIINNTPAASYESEIRDILNIETWLTSLAIDRFTNNWDSYMDHGRNYYFYFDSTDMKFQWIPWDYNLSFDWQKFDIMEPVTMKPLIQNMYDNPNLREEYLNIMCSLVDTDFDPDSLNPKVVHLADMIRTSVYADTKKESSDMDFEDAVAAALPPGSPPWASNIQTDISNHHSDYVSELTALSHTCMPVTLSPVVMNEYAPPVPTPPLSIYNPIVASESFKVLAYPNPAVTYTSFNIVSTETLNYDVQIFDAMGKTISVIENNSVRTLEFDVNSLSSGIYFFRIDNEGGSIASGSFMVK